MSHRKQYKLVLFIFGQVLVDLFEFTLSFVLLICVRFNDSPIKDKINKGNVREYSFFFKYIVIVIIAREKLFKVTRKKRKIVKNFN